MTPFIFDRNIIAASCERGQQEDLKHHGLFVS